VIANRLRARPRLRLLLSGDRTPLGMYAALRAHARYGELPSRDATVLQLDECAGFGPDDPRSRAASLAHELRGVELRALHGLDGGAPDLPPSARAIRRCSTRRRSISPSSGSARTGTRRSTSLARRIGAAAATLATSPRTSGGIPPSSLVKLTEDLERDLMLASRELADVHDRALLELSSLRDTPSAP
jgi:hypothetical protein